MANFGPLLRGSFTNPMLITAFDTYLTSRSVRAWCQVSDSLVSSLGPKTQPSTYWGLNQDPSDSQYSALTQFSMSLAHKYINLKESYNQDTKEPPKVFK